MRLYCLPVSWSLQCTKEKLLGKPGQACNGDNQSLPLLFPRHKKGILARLRLWLLPLPTQLQQSRPCGH